MLLQRFGREAVRGVGSPVRGPRVSSRSSSPAAEVADQAEGVAESQAEARRAKAEGSRLRRTGARRDLQQPVIVMGAISLGTHGWSATHVRMELFLITFVAGLVAGRVLLRP